MIKFDYAVISHYDKMTSRLYFKSTTSDLLYYFEFSWNYIKNIFNHTWYLLWFPLKRKHIKNL